MIVLKTIHFLLVSLFRTCDFFSKPISLKTITPAYTGFDIASNYDGERICQGMIITYAETSLFNLVVDWVTGITHVHKPCFLLISRTQVCSGTGVTSIFSKK